MAQNPLELERVRYWQGQLLASGDLNTQLRVDQRLRWLHNRSLHQPYGIAIGLELERDEGTDEIKVGNDNVNVICGLAYDCAGRELILQSNRALALPEQFPATLVITRDETTADGIALKWKAPSRINPNIEIAITTLTHGLPNPKADPAFRQVVSRPLARPRMASGQTIPGETAWQRWKIGETDVGVKVEIDTSAAGFTRVPHYFAEVIPGSPTEDFIPAWFASIDNPSTQGFTFQLMLRRITRETLRIADPKGQIVQVLPVLTLNESNLFAPLDPVARLLPLVEDASLIKSKVADSVTLDKPLINFRGQKFVAVGNTRREAIAKNLTFFEVTVGNPDLFAEGNVVVKLNGDPATTRPSRVAAIDSGTGTLKLASVIPGLGSNESLGIVKAASVVTNVGDRKEITVKDATAYAVGDVVVRLIESVEASAPAKITGKNQGNILVLSSPMGDLNNGDSLGFARNTIKVSKVKNKDGVKIEFDNLPAFAKGDLLAKGKPNDFSAPVFVTDVLPDEKQIVLSSLIGGLVQGDTIVAGDFSVRATVISVPTLATLTVTDATLFPPGSHIAKIDKGFAASISVEVTSVSGQTLTLSAGIDGLKAGEVIGLCTFPVVVTVVNASRNDGGIEVSPAGILRNGDLIAAPAASGEKIDVALITNITGNVINVLKPFDKTLKVGDRLSVVSIRGAMKASHADGESKTTVTQPERLRVGDFLADITSWRQIQVAARVQTVNSNEIQLDIPLDGVLINDIVGLASIEPFVFFFTILIQLRLEKSLELLTGDEVLVIGFDRLTGKTHNLVASVALFISETKTLFLKLSDATKFTFRPEDISASILFVRGDPMALISKHDLFVSWLAVGQPASMPRPCSGTEAAGCDCSQAKE